MLIIYNNGLIACYIVLKLYRNAHYAQFPGGTMRTSSLNNKYPVSVMTGLMILMILSLFIFNLNAHAAGTSSTPTKSASDIRKEANVFFNKGVQLQEAEKYKEAAREYEKALKIDSKYAEAWSNLGYTLRKRGKFDRAVKTYKKAIKLDPSLAEAHEYLGEAYAEMGKFDLAEKELKILRDLGSDEADELEEFISKKKAEKS
jgi:tetratricopeptide (TPR) repeat protein